MTIMYLNLSIVYVFSLFSRFVVKPNGLEENEIKPNKLFALLAVSSLVVVSGLRNNIGDTYYYMHSYRITEFNWESFRFEGDFGFNLLQMLLQQFSSDPQILLFTTALLTNVLIGLTLYNYSRLFELSLYVYITLGYFLVSMNGVRQYLAAAIIFAATKYLIEGDWKRYMLIVLFASTIHQTALILIPIYFIVRMPAWSKITYVLLITSILIVIGFDTFLNILFIAMEGTQYEGYKEFQAEGANFLRVIVVAVPIVVAYLGKEKLKDILPSSDVIVNMAVLGLLFMIISTQNWIFARFSIYFGLYQLILVSWIVKLFKEKDQKLIYYGILVCYFIYFYFEHAISLNINYRSNYIFF
ncbi:transmembrane protein EpsG [Evansella vedderi]|uniref:Transmembrane protein EpsG n=1 Tax=Evansella vedderi TaxID=38282 RepID=A0ABT9ZQD1_9BACI|nr:EpsG family protein [Evansella vedderi]MDQ0253160.1 transmembrane protein EpsG [Evansella vedderi]